jgi:hypothetical protein
MRDDFLYVGLTPTFVGPSLGLYGVETNDVAFAQI